MHLWLAKPFTGPPDDTSEQGLTAVEQAEATADAIKRRFAGRPEHELRRANTTVLTAGYNSCISMANTVASVLGVNACIAYGLPSNSSSGSASKGPENTSMAYSKVLLDYNDVPAKLPVKLSAVGLAKSVRMIAQTSPVTDLILVMPADTLVHTVGALSPVEDAVRVGDAACFITLQVSAGIARLVAPALLPFRFTDSEDWFSTNEDVWRRVILPFLAARAVSSGSVRMLELGSWEGRSATWLLQNAIRDDAPPADWKLICVDHFDLMRTTPGRKRRSDLEYNLRLTGKRDVVDVREGFTVPVLTDLLREGAVFDFAYIDASHKRTDVLLDLALT